MTKTTTTDKTIRRSKRQQGLDVTPLEVKTAKRAKRLAKSVADEQQQQQVSEPEADQSVEEEEADPAVQQNGVEGEEEETEQNGEEHEAEQHENVDNSPAECVTDQSKTEKKRTRGPTRMSKLAKSNGDKIDVEFNIIGNHVGKGSVTLSTFMGVLVREHVSVLLDDWRYLDAKIKDTMWEQLQGTFNLTEDWQKHTLLMQMGNTWRSHKSKLLKKVRLAKTKGEIRDLKPSNIHSESAWFKWVKTRTGKAFEERSEVYRAMKKSQIPQTSSRKGFSRLEDEMKKKAPDPSKVTRSKVWIAGHTHADGRPLKPEFQEKIEQIKSLDSEIASNSTVSVKEDAVSQILGRDRSGRVRGMGRGVTASKLAWLQARDAHVLKIEAEQAELKSEVADLRHLVHDLTKGKRDDGANSDTAYEPRCQLLDWSVDAEVVVADGKLCSVEPSYKIGRMPIGPNGSAVLVNFVSDKNASLWRPTSTVNKLGQTVGTKIAWPFDKLIVDRMDSTGNKGPDASATTRKEDRVQLVDWILGGEVIAEAHMISKDPEQLVNQIPLGPNAAMVKIVEVFNKEASLWRPPSEDIFVMGDALLVNIAWPLSKLSKCNGHRMDAESESEADSFNAEGGRTSSKGARTSGSKEVETKESSPKTAASNSSNNSNLAQKTCFLIDCFGSGEKVAEAKVLSTNPNDTVHCHPLGPNASKVWVKVDLIGTAKVWRPTSEFQIISDALGTTIAWPNANIVYM